MHARTHRCFRVRQAVLNTHAEDLCVRSTTDKTTLACRMSLSCCYLRLLFMLRGHQCYQVAVSHVHDLSAFAEQKLIWSLDVSCQKASYVKFHESQNSSIKRTWVRKMCNTRCKLMLWSNLTISIWIHFTRIHDVTPFVAFSCNVHASEWITSKINCWIVMWISHYLHPQELWILCIVLRQSFLELISKRHSIAREHKNSMKWDWRRLIPQCLVSNVFQYLKSVS